MECLNPSLLVVGVIGSGAVVELVVPAMIVTRYDSGRFSYSYTFTE